VKGVPSPIPDAAATCGDTPDCAPTAGRTSWGAQLPAGTPTYNHIDELFQTGTTADNNLQVSGGNDRTSFFASAGLTNQLGVAKRSAAARTTTIRSSSSTARAIAASLDAPSPTSTPIGGRSRG